MRKVLTLIAGAGLVALASTGSANAGILWHPMPAGCVWVPTGLSEPVLVAECPGYTLSHWVVNPVRGGHEGPNGYNPPKRYICYPNPE